MQKNAQASKRRVLFDGVEIPGLTAMGEIALEKGQIEVPEYKITRKISDNVKKIPALAMTFRRDRDTQTSKFFDDWWNNDEVKDVTVIETDGHGITYKESLWPKCELVKKTTPPYEAQSPTYSQYQVEIISWDIIDLE
jgi:hypothetical protein